MFDQNKNETFDIQKTKDYILSIQVSLDGFSFFAIFPDDKSVVAYKSTPIKISSTNLLGRRLKEWLESEDLLRNQFKSIRTFVFADNFSLVPDGYFEPELQRNLTSVLFDNKVHNHFIENKIEDLKASIIFPVSQEIITILNHFFDRDVEIIHPLTKLLQQPLKSEKRNLSVIISTNGFFYLIIKQNRELVLANSFPVVHQNDLIYNVLNTFQQLGVARSETELFVASAMHANTEVESLLKPYFENINLMKITDLMANPEIVNSSN